MAFPIIPKKRSGATGSPTSLNVGELAVNTATGELFLGGDSAVLLLNPPTAAGTTATERTGDGTTTAFTFTGYNGTTDGGYLVSVGGIDQPPSKYAVTSTAGGTITFVEAPTAGELISIRALVASGGGGGVSQTSRTRYIGTGDQIDFSPIEGFVDTNPLRLFVDIDGIMKDPDPTNGDFIVSSLNGGTITFNVPPVNNSRIIARVLGATGNLEVPKKINAWYIDSSTFAHYVEATGEPINFDDGQGVKGAEFYGGNNYFSILASGTEFNFGGSNSTIEFWLYPTSASYQSIISATAALNFHTFTDGKLYINNGISGDASVTISFNAWQHIACVIDNSVKYVYVNGALQSTTTQMFNPISTLNIGSVNGFTGKIAGLRTVTGTAVYTTDFIVPSTLLTAVTDTSLLMNFGATAVPSV